MRDILGRQLPEPTDYKSHYKVSEAYHEIIKDIQESISTYKNSTNVEKYKVEIETLELKLQENKEGLLKIVGDMIVKFPCDFYAVQMLSIVFFNDSIREREGDEFYPIIKKLYAYRKAKIEFEAITEFFKSGEAKPEDVSGFFKSRLEEKKKLDKTEELGYSIYHWSQ